MHLVPTQMHKMGEQFGERVTQAIIGYTITRVTDRRLGCSSSGCAAPKGSRSPLDRLTSRGVGGRPRHNATTWAPLYRNPLMAPVGTEAHASRLLKRRTTGARYRYCLQEWEGHKGGGKMSTGEPPRKRNKWCSAITENMPDNDCTGEKGTARIKWVASIPGALQNVTRKIAR